MAKDFLQIRRAFRIVAGVFLLGSIGCAFPHGATQGDPILGNFHRPIVPTPPPERGGIGLDSPAYDGGARIGMGVPEVPTAVENSNGFMTLPNLSSPNLFSGMKMPFTNNTDTYARQMPTHQGARLPGLAPSNAVNVPMLPQAWTSTPGTVVARPSHPTSRITSASAIDPVVSPQEIRQTRYESAREPVRIFTMEEGQSALDKLGAKHQRLEQVENGDWLFSCSYGYKSYESRSREKMDSIRSVIDQIQKDN